jgi:DNA-directed RNA polymerase specialized sigma24 family protein
LGLAGDSNRYAGDPTNSDIRISVRVAVAARITVWRQHRPQMQADADKSGGLSDGDRFTVAEIGIAIGELADDEFSHLMRRARMYSRICGISADDLLQEAYARALDGSRTCGRDVNIVDFLRGVMRSLASQESEARKSGFRPAAVIVNGESTLPDVAADIVTPEQAAVSAIDDVQMLAKIDQMIASDEQLQLLVEGIYDGMRGVELQELLELDEKGLASLRKKLRRLLQDLPDRIAP